MKSVSNIQSFGKSRRTMMREATERVVDVAYLAKESKGKKERFLSVIIVKNLNMKRKIVGTRENFNASSAKDLSI